MVLSLAKAEKRWESWEWVVKNFQFLTDEFCFQAWSNCHIQLIQDTNIVTDAPKPLRIVGCPEAVESAKKYVAEILSNADDSPSSMVGNGPVSTVSVQVKVPRTTVGAIMGLQGKNIRRLSDETGTKIQFMQDDDAKLVERTLVIIGHQNKVYMAAQLIKEIVEANNTTGNVPIAVQHSQSQNLNNILF